MVTLAPEIRTVFQPVPLAGLVGRDPLAFPVYLATGAGLPVLYRDKSAEFDDSHLGRLQNEGVHELFIQESDAGAYHRRIEVQLDAVLRDRTASLECRADALYGVATAVGEDLLQAAPTPDDLDRARRVFLAGSGLLLRDPAAFSVVRRVLTHDGELRTHCLAVAFLSIGLARTVIGADPAAMATAGLAGLMHDIGRLGREHAPEDEGHVFEGLEVARRCRMPEAVCQAILSHHERWDGGGYPNCLVGRDIPVLARLVGLVDTFEIIYSQRKPRIGVYDALRILAEVYRGCFDQEMAVALVRSFRT